MKGKREACFHRAPSVERSPLVSSLCLRPPCHGSHSFLPACTPQIHAQNKQIAAAKAAMALAYEGGASDFEELSCEGEAYDPARPNDYMEYCKVRKGVIPPDLRY